jgi:hypothetical protein
MIANQRSGTHLIRSAVNSHPDAVCPVEPFYRNPVNTFVDLKHWMKQFDGIDEKAVLIDVKYDQITAPVRRLMGKAPVLHLVREDLKRIYFSILLRHWDHHIATPEEKRRWKAGEHTPKMPFDEARFNRFAERVRAARARYAPYVDETLTYEALTGNQEIHELPVWASEKLCRFLEVEVRPLTAGFKKLAPSTIDDCWEVVA